jgi:DNA-binding response OmpR family regulator
MSHEHIMMVEDDKLVLTLVTSRLRMEGYQITTADTVAQALRLIAEGLPDLLILDLTLLDNDPFAGLTDGFAFLRLLQRGNPDTDLPVVIYSVDDSPAVHAKAKTLGVAAVVQKGAAVDELLAVVRALLDERTARELEQPAAPPA